MKNDREVRLMRRERAKSRNQEVAAARTGMSVRTLRKYERAGKLPSQVKQSHTWQTRADPFIHDWPWVVGELERDPALQGKTLFEVLQEQHPGRYVPGQLRTLQRHIAAWRCMHGPEREVMFEQVHSPGEAIQSDFTHAADLAVMLDGTPFPHLLFHSVLTYSNVEAVSVCFSESFEALAEGLEAALPAFGGVPATHRTDNLSAAIRELGRDGRRDFTVAYRALLEHYGMIGSTNHPGVSHQNGDVESAHHQFKRALDQALRVRGHRDFRDRGAYEQFLTELVRRRNATRSERFAVEREHLRPLPPSPLLPCKELLVKVNRGSLSRVQGNVYSVPSRLIGARLRARLRGPRPSSSIRGRAWCCACRGSSGATASVSTTAISSAPCYASPGPLWLTSTVRRCSPRSCSARHSMPCRRNCPPALCANICICCIWRLTPQRLRWPRPWNNSWRPARCRPLRRAARYCPAPCRRWMRDCRPRS